MSTAPTPKQSRVKQLLAAVKELPAGELRQFQQQFTSWQKQQIPSQAAATTLEAELLARIQINSHLPQTAQRRYTKLRRKFSAETISEAELLDLQGLNSRLEWMAVERLEAAIELARLRGSDLNTLLRELGLVRTS